MLYYILLFYLFRSILEGLLSSLVKHNNFFVLFEFTSKFLDIICPQKRLTFLALKFLSVCFMSQFLVLLMAVVFGSL